MFHFKTGTGQPVFLIDDDKEIAQLKEAFAEVPAVYIADGHHRAASAVKVSERKRKANPGYSGEEEFNYFLSVLFPDEELFIMDYNRIVKDLNGMTQEDFLSRMKEHFRVSPCTKEERRPKEKGMFGMYLGGQWYQCQIHEKDKSSDRWKTWMSSSCRRRCLRRSLGSQSQRQMRVFPLPAESAGWIIWKRKWMADGQWHSQCIRPRSRSCSRLRTPENLCRQNPPGLNRNFTVVCSYMN